MFRNIFNLFMITCFTVYYKVHATWHACTVMQATAQLSTLGSGVPEMLFLSFDNHGFCDPDHHPGRILGDNQNFQGILELYNSIYRGSVF